VVGSSLRVCAAPACWLILRLASCFKLGLGLGACCMLPVRGVHWSHLVLLLFAFLHLVSCSRALARSWLGACCCLFGAPLLRWLHALCVCCQCMPYNGLGSLGSLGLSSGPSHFRFPALDLMLTYPSPPRTLTSPLNKHPAPTSIRRHLRSRHTRPPM
jgi:hypothetical protein